MSVHLSVCLQFCHIFWSTGQLSGFIISHEFLFVFQKMRYLENSYDKTKLKIDEATHLKRIYEDIKRKLEVVCYLFSDKALM